MLHWIMVAQKRLINGNADIILMLRIPSLVKGFFILSHLKMLTVKPACNTNVIVKIKYYCIELLTKLFDDAK